MAVKLGFRGILMIFFTARRFSLLAGLVVSAAISARAENVKLDYQSRTLANGLQVITHEDFSCPVVSVQVWYHVGSKDENPQRQGFAHMFEHMMFRGTEHLGPKAHFELIRRTGGDCNAYTSFDNTTYVNKLPANQLQLALYLEAERMAFLRIDQESFNTERAVVEEERRLGQNAPYGTVAEKVLPVIFEKHAYRWTPIGQIPHLRRATIEELARFWETYYVPNNATLVIVGAVTHDDAQKLAERYFDWIPRGGDIPRIREMEPAQAAPREITVSEPKGPVTLVALAFRGPTQSDDDFVPLQVLLHALGDGDSSRMYQDLVKDKDLCVAAGAAPFGLEQDGIAVAYAVVKPFGAKKETVLEALRKRLEDIKTNLPTADEIAKAKTELTRSAVEAATTVESKSQLLGTYAVLHGDVSRVNQRFEQIQRVTVDDLKRVADKYLVEERRTTVIIEPSMGEMLRSLFKGKGDDEVPAPTSQPGDRDRLASRQGPKAAAARPKDFPSTAPVQPLLGEIPPAARHEQTLQNGLKIVLVPNDEVPLVSMTLGLKFGAFADDPDRRGAASLAASLITKGTENYDSKKLATELQSHAISLTGSMGMDVGSVNAACMRDEADRAMRLLAEVVRRPTFPKREFNRQRDQLQTSLAVNEQTPSYLADREFRRRVFGEHPYAHIGTGEAADVRKLEQDDLKRWWQAHVRPDTCVLYVAGDVTPEAGRALAEKYFGDWKSSGDPPAVAVPPAPANTGTRIWLVDKPNTVQSEIRAGHVGITREHSDYQAARVLSQIFGGAFHSRLNESLRVQKGLTYAAFGGMSAERFAGTFTISTFSKTATTADAVRAIIDEVRLLQSAGVQDNELTDSRSFIVGSFAINRERPRDTVNDLWLIEYCGLPNDYLQRSLTQVGQTSAQDVMRVAENRIDPNELTIVVVGDAKKVQGDLAKIAPLTVIPAPGAKSTTQPATMPSE
jgi:zinc protease